VSLAPDGTMTLEVQGASAVALGPDLSDNLWVDVEA
jgi:hypothetical protein